MASSGVKLLATALLVLSAASLIAASCKDIKGNVTHCHELDDTTTLAWKILPDGTVNVTSYCVPAKPFGWCGWGPSPAGKMQGSSTVISYTNNKQDTSQTAITQFYLPEQKIVLANQGDLTIVSKSVTFDSEGNAFSNVVLQLDTAQPKWIIWARGLGIVTYAPDGNGPSGTTLVQHSIANHAAAVVNFKTGAVGATAGGGLPLDYVKYHATLSTVGFGILFPLGFLFSRHIRVLPGTDPLWFYLHIAFMVCGWIIGVVGFGYGIQLYEWSTNVKMAHFELGISVVVTATLQILTPIFKPDKDSKIRLYWNLVHHAFGYTTITIAIINIYWGFTITTGPEYPDQQYDTWRYNYTIFLWVWAGVFAVLEVFTWLLWLKNRKAGEAAEEEKLKDVEP